jgi:hypothetical protein
MIVNSRHVGVRRATGANSRAEVRATFCLNYRSPNGRVAVGRKIAGAGAAHAPRLES